MIASFIEVLQLVISQIDYFIDLEDIHFPINVVRYPSNNILLIRPFFMLVTSCKICMLAFKKLEQGLPKDRSR